MPERDLSWRSPEHTPARHSGQFHDLVENGAYRSSSQLGPPYRIGPSMLDGVELELGALVNDGGV
ncbi:MAG: hypothetical protein KFB96_08275 [Thiocapsa sp.]|uniref:hypothetical protein n=1 Tax=Thiocapsa sp. TaxID=2024551 RepID=UPI001BCBF355|nr:hypothetical protein [Thiocapsa sp.]QVL50413.1 MAG: hypothetical protein KFB96_08275 [Thiocapsa sp.]